MFDPMNADGKRKKVTILECLLRLSIMIGPIIFPYLFLEDDGRWVWGVLWIGVMGPFFAIPLAGEDEREDGTHIFKRLFESVGMLYLGLILLSGLLALLGPGRVNY